MKGLRWSTRTRKNEDKHKGSGHSIGTSSNSAPSSHRGSTTSTNSGLSISRHGSLPKSASNLYLSESQSRSQRSLSSSSSRHDLQTVTDEESIDSIPGHSNSLTPVISSNKDSMTINGGSGSTYAINNLTYDNKHASSVSNNDQSNADIRSESLDRSHTCLLYTSSISKTTESLAFSKYGNWAIGYIRHISKGKRNDDKVGQLSI